MIRYIFLTLCVLCNLTMFPGEGYMFRLQLKDKGKTSYSADSPEQFLSKRAIDRRNKQNIGINETDMPISSEYIKTIEDLGCRVIARSKWLSTISIYCNDSLLVDKLKGLDFISYTTFVWKGDTISTASKEITRSKRSATKSTNEYGYSNDQIKTVNGQFLHTEGYKGKGFEIAVIDAGYRNLNELLLLDNISIKGVKDFVFKGEDVFKSSDHGLKVLSVLATNRPGIFIGSAPEAKYWLLRSEDNRSEFPVEEDYFVAAAEYADSVGVDIINASLGYHTYQIPAQSYTHEQLDGKTAYITRAAEIAASKGILVEVSAGNEGSNSWKKIAFPADAASVLTVGAIAKDSTIAYFSSAGLTADGRIKPDVVALGLNTSVIAASGEVEPAQGTSFSGPIISGLAACLWQSVPDLTNLELVDIIRKSGDRYNKPDAKYGYGIPNMKTAYLLAKNTPTGIEEEAKENREPLFQIESDSTGHIRVICKKNMSDGMFNIKIFNLDGKVVFDGFLTEKEQEFYLNDSSKQIRIVTITGAGIRESYKTIF